MSPKRSLSRGDSKISRNESPHLGKEGTFSTSIDILLIELRLIRFLGGNRKCVNPLADASGGVDSNSKTGKGGCLGAYRNTAVCQVFEMKSELYITNASVRANIN